MALEDSLKAYVDGLVKASDIFVEKSPDLIIAPMMGSVPFIDVIHILNDDFEVNNVYYMPASSSLPDVNKIMATWMKNFLDSNLRANKPTKLMGIDEVVSGSSSTRVYRAITHALENKKKEFVSTYLFSLASPDEKVFKTAAIEIDALTNSQHYGLISQIAEEQCKEVYELDRNLAITRQNQVKKILQDYFKDAFTYVGIGIEDDKLERKGKSRSHQYLEIRESGGIIPIPIKAILTMDKPDLCPVQFKQVYDKNKCDRAIAIVEPSDYENVPEIGGFNISPKYINFLSTVAREGGKNPDNISPINMKRIMESSKYL